MKCLLFEVFFPFVRFYSVPPHSVLPHPILFFPSFPTPFKPISFRSKQYEFGSSTMSRKIAGRRARKKRTFESLSVLFNYVRPQDIHFSSPEFLSSTSEKREILVRTRFSILTAWWNHLEKEQTPSFPPALPYLPVCESSESKVGIEVCKNIKLQSRLRTTGLDGL